MYHPATATTSAEDSGQLVVTPLYRKAMPLLRCNLEDTVELAYRDCDCGWHLPVIRVLGRSAFGYPVGSVRVTQHDLEELVFALPAEHEVVFWRAKAQPHLLRVEVEVSPAQRSAAVTALDQAIRSRLGAPCDVRGVDPGTLVPQATLTTSQDVVKPRSLFGADEDWSKGLLYY